MTDAEMLALVETAIARRLAGDAYEAYTEAGKRFQGATLEQLFKIRDDLQAKIDAETGTCHRLAQPFNE